jgi:hypothetical protein
MQALVDLLGLDADSDAGQLLMAALGLRRIIIRSADEALSDDLGREDTGGEGFSEGNDEGENDEETDMEIDEI